jgi:hypothetical protein
MSNRNFDSRVIIQRLTDLNNAQNLYHYQKQGIQSIRNPQTSDSSSSRINSYERGQETTYYKNLIGGGYTSSIGGVANILAENVPILIESSPSLPVPIAPVITGIFTNRPPPGSGFPATTEIYFTQGSDGGSSITNYKYSFDNVNYISFSPEQISSPLIITGLSSGTYNVTIKAVNVNGDSEASNEVTEIIV